jgi:uncharacterized Zn-finger protein
MPKKIYDCTDCSKTFSRKYNAERHNEKLHNQMANIYDKETGWILDNTKIDDTYQVKQDSFPSLSSNTTTMLSTLSEIENKNSSNNNSNSMFNSMKDYNLLDSFSTIDLLHN